MEILTNTGATLWSKDDYSELWLDVFEQITGTGGKSNIRLIDEAIGNINSALDGYYLLYENDRLYICKDNTESGTTTTSKLPVSLIQSDGKVASSVDGTTITIDENGIVHGTTIDDVFSLTSENAIQNKVVKAKFDEVDQKINANETTISSHISDNNNPHNVTKSQVGLGNVENKSSDTIRGELSKSNVTTALGYTPYTPTEVDNKLSALETNIDWKEAVDTFADIATTYPNPNDGWTVNVKDTDYTYRYNGSKWVTISANAIPKATNSVDGLLSKEDHANYDDAASKAHTHDNKSVLDGITSDKVTAWDNKSDFSGDYSDLSNKPTIPKGDGTTITMDEDGTLHGSVTIEVDSELSTTSENPIQNKVVTKKLTDHIDASVTDAEGVHGFKVSSDKKAYAKINGAWEEIAGGGGGGESSKTTFNITTTATSLAGKTVELYTVDGIQVTSSQFSDSLSCIISVSISAGNYYLLCDDYKYEISIIATGNTITIDFDEATYHVTFTVTGANEDNITISGNGITPVNVIFGTSQTSKSVTMTLTPFLNGKSFTFTSTVAKDTTNGTSNYVKDIAINKSTKEVKVMPDCVAYWYGNYIVGFSVDTSLRYFNNELFPVGGTLTVAEYKNKFHLHQYTVDRHSIAYTSNSFINTQGKSKFCISVSNGINNPGGFYSGIQFSAYKKNIITNDNNLILLSYSGEDFNTKLNFGGIFKKDFDASKTEFDDYIIICFWGGSANNQYIELDVNAIWCE